MDNCPNCHTLTTRLDNAEAARRNLAADLMAAKLTSHRAETAQYVASRAFQDWSDAEPGSPEGERARRELAAALMDLHAFQRSIGKALDAIEDRYADLADELASPVPS
mgnify:CR=1 FL=1